MTGRGRVVVAGSANVDLVVDVPRPPRAGETILGGDLRRSPGGKGANQAVAAARAGGADTTFLGTLGDDEPAGLLLASLDGAGVRTDLVEHVSVPTGTAFITVSPGGENTIVVAPGANARLRLGARHGDRIAAADVVLTQLEVPLDVVRAAAAARRPGALLALNAAPSRRLPRDVWDTVDLLIVNEHEAAELAGDTAGPDTLARALRERVPAVVITLGRQGCLVAEGDRAPLHIPGVPVEAVDTTGAGDTFCGALCAALARALPLPEAARLAGAAAALAVTRPGAQAAVPTADEVAAFAAGGNAR
ncbi:ribokinase [Prauserella shujinwangii]|uniref:Ribokinase n=1 Tax=Prauserella shujinwangii TaxID=1453103 RepID=A0A2T0M2C3_9PSEU|nr:ribokinase [Prauserella shujinwangii]PRX50887.1 ribokinase [Prauserella shujinwangii]